MNTKVIVDNFYYMLECLDVPSYYQLSSAKQAQKGFVSNSTYSGPSGDIVGLNYFPCTSICSKIQKFKNNPDNYELTLSQNTLKSIVAFFNLNLTPGTTFENFCSFKLSSDGNNRKKISSPNLEECKRAEKVEGVYVVYYLNPKIENASDNEIVHMGLLKLDHTIKSSIQESTIHNNASLVLNLSIEQIKAAYTCLETRPKADLFKVVSIDNKKLQELRQYHGDFMVTQRNLFINLNGCGIRHDSKIILSMDTSRYFNNADDKKRGLVGADGFFITTEFGQFNNACEKTCILNAKYIDVIAPYTKYTNETIKDRLYITESMPILKIDPNNDSWYDHFIVPNIKPSMKEEFYI